MRTCGITFLILFKIKKVNAWQKVKNFIDEIFEMKDKNLSCYGDEAKEKAIEGAIDFETKSGIKYITYGENGSFFLKFARTMMHVKGVSQNSQAIEERIAKMS